MADSTISVLIPPPVTLDLVAEAHRDKVGVDAGPMKIMLARAMVPMDPRELLPILAFLGDGTDDEAAEAARKTPLDLPKSLVQTVLADSSTHPAVLAYYARLLHEDSELLETILTNPSTPDATFYLLARSLKDKDLLDTIALNHVRCLRTVEIIEALFYNQATRQASVSRLIDLAVRNSVSLSHLRGFKAIEAAFKAEARDSRESEEVAEVEPKEEEREEEYDVGSRPDSLVRDDDFDALLSQVAEEMDGSPPPSEVEPGELENSRALYKVIKDMSISQKVRLAVVGNGTARSLLIRDPRKLVAMSVLANPRLTEKEIVMFVMQKSLDEDIVRSIARNRDWTRLYTTRLALVKNPKTPATTALGFLGTFHERDLKSLSKDKEIPGYIQKIARETLERRVKRRR